MIENLLILLIGVAIGVGITARLERKRTGEREVRINVHEMELITMALVRAKSALIETYARFGLTDGPKGGYHAVLSDALAAVKLALGEGNGHAPKHDDQKRAWL